MILPPNKSPEPASTVRLHYFARVNATLQFSVLLALFFTACGSHQSSPAPVPLVRKQIVTPADAIAVVLADIQRRGGDPRREECSATKTDEGWDVTAWHIFYPANSGSSRFVPGGFTDYVVGQDGRIVKTMLGL